MTPAPGWRRLAAVGYDALVLAALWMVVAMAVTALNQLTPISHSGVVMRAAMILVGAAFFCWFWTHGGQTLGMRAWRLRVLTTDGAPMRLPMALLRYLVGSLPAIAALYAVARFGNFALVVILAGYVPCFIDARKRALHDLASGSEVVLQERGASAPDGGGSALEREGSAQLAQPPERDDDQERRRQAG